MLQRCRPQPKGEPLPDADLSSVRGREVAVSQGPIVPASDVGRDDVRPLAPLEPHHPDPGSPYPYFGGV